ncbi:MAG: hypothetical protein LBW85_01180 [Deltaproteobacteria bacterium]|jgi:hypothetical protein|nr:hypothetical protein [Deltaproteobacteria bacterium]
MAGILARSVLTAPFDVSVEYPAGNARDNQPGAARVSLAGSWTGTVTLLTSLGDGDWTVVKAYSKGPEDDVAVIGSRRELFRFEAESDFAGVAKVIVAQGEVLP